MVVLAASAGRTGASTHADGRFAFGTIDDSVAVANADGSGVWPAGSVQASSLSWTPDGSRLAARISSPSEGIAILRPDGHVDRMLTTDPNDHDPAWSPDGGSMAVGNGNDLDVIDIASGARRPLFVSHSGPVAAPSWSPDGGTIVFVNGSFVDELDVGTGADRQITVGTDPSWSPDGSTVAFVLPIGQSTSIFEMNPDGSNLRPITTDALVGRPVWSPDGRQIAYSGFGPVASAASVFTWGIYVVGRDGGEPQEIVALPARAVAWQPIVPQAGCTITGTTADDLLVGTAGSDVICGGGGNDTLIGLAGDDTLIGGTGDDRLAGGLGSDTLDGGPGDDTLDARGGAHDTLLGGTGRDNAIVGDGRSTTRSVESVRVDRDLAAWRPASDDVHRQANVPQLAFDGDPSTRWSSGDEEPPHWVEVDLQKPTNVSKLVLTAPPLGPGESAVVLGTRAAGGPFRVLYRIEGKPYRKKQPITVRPKHPWHGIRYIRIEVSGGSEGSSWPELAVYGTR